MLFRACTLVIFVFRFRSAIVRGAAAFGASATVAFRFVSFGAVGRRRTLRSRFVSGFFGRLADVDRRRANAGDVARLAAFVTIFVTVGTAAAFVIAAVRILTAVAGNVARTTASETGATIIHPSSISSRTKARQMTGATAAVANRSIAIVREILDTTSAIVLCAFASQMTSHTATVAFHDF